MFTLLIPVYNEAENILRALRAIRHEVSGSYSILIVYDRDDDTSLPYVERFRAECPDADIKTVKNAFGRGVLGALKTGFDAVKTEFVVVTMADLSDPPKVINHLVATAVKEKADIVCASRYMKGGKHIGGPRLKKTLSRLAGVSLHKLIQIPTHDITNNFRLYRTSVLKQIEVESDGGFELAIELTVKAYARGFRIREVPTTWKDRVEGVSKFKLFKWLPKYLRWFCYGLKHRTSLQNA